MGGTEIRYRSIADYMASYNILVYITIGLALFGFIKFGLLVFAALPAIYLVVQRQAFSKKAGTVAFTIYEKGIQNMWAAMPWEEIREVRIERFSRKHDFTFTHIVNGQERFYRYNLNELEIMPEELFNIVQQYHPIEVVKQTHTA